MAESSLSISYSDLMLEVAAYLGYGNSPEDWTTGQRNEVDRYIQAGIRQFYYPPAVNGLNAHEWSFLQPHAELTITADEEATELPADLGRVLGDFFHAAESYLPSVVQVSESRIMSFRAKNNESGTPKFAHVRYKAGTTETAGQRLEVLWYPKPDKDYKLNFSYEAYSGKLTTERPYPLGGMKYAELVTESCLAIAEQRANDENSLHTRRFQELLAAAVKLDERQGARYYGQMGGGESNYAVPRMRSGEVYYKGKRL